MKKAIIYIVITLSVVACAVFVGYLYMGKLGTTVRNEQEPSAIPTNEIQEVVEKQVQIYKGTDRPIAIMIDNHKSAMPHAGLSKAYIVYEIIVEGGETRLMALFKGVNVDKIGPVRSARHYFIDYALENDAIYTHYGWSPQAEKDIGTLRINNINGLTESEKDFWRSKDKKAPHNVVTSTENIYKIAKNKNYRITSSTSSVLNYITDEVNLDEKYKSISSNENIVQTDDKNITVMNASEVKIPYSKSNNVRWVYNEANKKYERYSKGIKETEWYENTDVTAKNIIIQFVKNKSIDEKDRQDLNTTGTKKGYYITNGKAISITCSKSSRSSKTEYEDSNGNAIDVNDGNTFIQICPEGANVEII